MSKVTKQERDAAEAEYDKASAAAYAEYERVRDVAKAELEKMCAAAWAEFRKVRDAE